MSAPSNLPLISVLVTGTISFLGVLLSFYALRSHKALTLLTHVTAESKEWATRMRAIVSEHVSLAGTLFLADEAFDPIEERALVQKMMALEAEASILLASGSPTEGLLREALPNLRRLAIRQRDHPQDSVPSSSEFTHLRDSIVSLAGDITTTRLRNIRASQKRLS